MKLGRIYDLEISRYFLNILPIASHSSYTYDLEFSDKIVLPGSVLKELQRVKAPVPPQFLLISERPFHNDIYCTSLEFSAEEEFIYLPWWMIKELGFKVVSQDKGLKRPVKTGYGVILKTVEMALRFSSISYAVPRCKLIEYYLEKEHDSSEIKKELSKYLFVRDQTDVSLFLNNSIVLIKITKVVPGPIGTLERDYEIKRSEFLPEIKTKPKKPEPSQLSQTENLEKVMRERIPEFLKDLLKRQQTKEDKKNKKNNIKERKVKIIHIKNLSCPSPERTESTFEILEEKIQTVSKEIGTGKSIDYFDWHLPAIPKQKICHQTLLTLALPQSTTNKIHKITKKKLRSFTPVVVPIKTKLVDTSYIQGVKLINP